LVLFSRFQGEAAKEATMNVSVTSNLHLLGISELTLSALREGNLPFTAISGQSQAQSLFSSLLTDLCQEDTEETSQGMITNDCALNSLSRIYLDSVLAAMIPAGVVESEATDGTDSQNTETDSDTSGVSAEESLTTTSSTDSTATAAGLTPMQVVYASGNSQQDLLDSINGATTLEERLDYVTQLRDVIIEALRQEGYTAYDIGKPDKISIDGTLYDVVRASKALGNDAAVQFLEVQPATTSTQMSGAIFSAGESLIDSLPRISSSFDLEERRQLAVEFRDQLVENLNANGYSATAGESPDKIVVDGVTYDIIRNLNAPGAAVRLQAIQVG
jgi:hypothetical protein